MPGAERIRQGDIYWLDGCAPLAGDVAKRRPVIVISDQAAIDAGEPVLVVAAASTTVLATSAPDRIALPNLQQNPGCRTGLPKPCWVVPAWYLAVARSRLVEKAGALSGAMRARVVRAVHRRMLADEKGRTL